VVRRKSGGLLRPSVAIGALLPTLIGAAWSLAWPSALPAAFAIVGAAGFLAASMQIPITAIV
jgi:H+/Cl- antiporter ClcA